MKRIFFKRAQSLTELALIIGVVGLVFISMEAYIKRGLQGKVKDLTDNLIGKEQAVYSVDTSDLEINSSGDPPNVTTLYSKEVVNVERGGQKGVEAYEESTASTNSYSEDAQ